MSLIRPAGLKKTVYIELGSFLRGMGRHLPVSHKTWRAQELWDCRGLASFVLGFKGRRIKSSGVWGSGIQGFTLGLLCLFRGSGV